MCAHAVRVAIEKLPGVASVDVSLERAVADVRLRSGNTITLSQLRDIVEDNGFTSKAAHVIIVGELVEREARPALSVSGTGLVIPIVADPKHRDVFERVQDRLRTRQVGPIELRGVIDGREDQPERLVVGAVAEAAR